MAAEWLKDFVQGGLPQVLDFPNRQTTVRADERNIAQRVETVAPDNAQPRENFVTTAAKNNQALLIVGGIVAAGLIVALVMRK